MTTIDSLKVTSDLFNSLESKSALTDFLMRPVRLADGSWGMASSPATILETFNFPASLISSSPMYKQKMAGFLSFRATLVIKLQVNASATHAGRLLLSYLPLGNLDGMYPDMRFRNFASMTSLPHVEYDLFNHSEAILEVPYISSMNSMEINNSPKMGQCRLVVMHPLLTGTSSATINYTVWASFKDVELLTPAYNAQMGNLKKQNKKNYTEVESSNTGPVSSVLAFGSTVAGALSTVPLLSHIAAPASWVLAASASLASAFGYSKPLVTSPPIRTIQSSTPYETYCDGSTISLPLSASVENKVTVLPGFAGTDIDETTISSLCARKVAWYYDEWYAAAPSDTLLFTCDLSPSFFKTLFGPTISQTIVEYLPISWVGSYFRYYRGSFTVTIKVSKTSSHSGRLLAVYNPGMTTASVGSNTEFTYREILDLSENTEWNIRCPYASVMPWRPTVGESSGTPTITDSPYGTFKLYILNELVHPDTVAARVDYTIWISSDDMEFAVPYSVEKMPYVINYQPQMGDCAADQYCIGEKVSSMLQLAKMSTYATTLGHATSSRWVYRPFTTGAASGYLGSAVPSPGDCFSARNHLASAFLLSRGGIRTIHYDVDVPTREGLASASLVPAIDDASIYSSSTGIIDCCRPVINFRIGDLVTYSVPQYTLGHSRVNRFSTAANDEPLDYYSDRSGVRLNVSAPWSSYTYQAASDDASFGCFLGVPPFLILDSDT